MAVGHTPPLRALVISLSALAVPVAGAFWVPEALEDYEALLWILAVVPAFLLAYYKAWRGAASALAGAMAAISVTYAITQATGREMPELMLPIVAILIALSLAIGALADRIYRKAGGLPSSGFTDPVTGLPNRAHAELHLEIEFNAARLGKSLSVVVLALDHFKEFTARHGAIAGDDVLRTLGDVMRKMNRRTNLAARFDEDEFLCILSNSDDDGAVAFVDRFQQTLQSYVGQRVFPTVSAGVASVSPSMKQGGDLLSAAQAALRQARKDGPGRVRVHGRSLAVPRTETAPVAPRASSPAAPDARSIMPQGRGRGRKALIVAEQPPVRALLARYLADHGFHVTQASNVVDGVQSLSNEYDLLFTDISLQDGIGVELVRAAKLRWASIQVIGLVLQPQGELSIDVLNAGVDRYLVTPLDLQKVREHITDLLARRDRVAASLLQSRQLTMEFEARTKEAMKALRETEEEYRTFVRTVHEIIFRIDPTGHFTFLNDAWEEVTGYTTESSIGKSAAGFVHEDDRAEFNSLVRALVAGGRENVRAELRLVSAQADVRWLELRARRFYGPDNSLTGVSGTLEDVTARRHAQEALRRSEAASRGLLAALPDEVLLLSREGVVLSHEGAGADRMHAQSAVGSTIEQVFPGPAALGVRALMDRAFADGTVQVHEFPVLEENDHREFEVRLAASGDDSVVAVIRNITRRKHLEIQLRQSQKLEAIGRLAGGLAHDFNNLLTVVQGNAHLLEEETQGNAAALDYLRQISTAAERGATLVRQLLAFGRRQVLQPATLNLNELVERTRSMLGRLIGEQILLQVDLDSEAGLIKADAGQIEQVLVNLAVNAREVLREHGMLRISTRNGALARHGAESDAPPENVVLLTVSDNGPGMDAETRERIFEPFFTTKGLAESSGLRLATVYGIVRQSGGTISVQSEPGQGTTFEIAFPRADD